MAKAVDPQNRENLLMGQGALQLGFLMRTRFAEPIRASGHEHRTERPDT